METFYAWVIKDGEVYWEEREGTLFSNRYDLELYASKNGDVWEIIEGKSGSVIVKGKSKRNAIATFKKYESKISMRFVINRCNKVIEIIGISPLYTNTPQCEILKRRSE